MPSPPAWCAGMPGPAAWPGTLLGWLCGAADELCPAPGLAGPPAPSPLPPRGCPLHRLLTQPRCSAAPPSPACTRPASGGEPARGACSRRAGRAQRWRAPLPLTCSQMLARCRACRRGCTGCEGPTCTAGCVQLLHSIQARQNAGRMAQRMSHPVAHQPPALHIAQSSGCITADRQGHDVHRPQPGPRACTFLRASCRCGRHGHGLHLCRCCMRHETSLR